MKEAQEIGSDPAEVIETGTAGFEDIPGEDDDGNVVIPQTDAPAKVVEPPSGMQINAGNVILDGPPVLDYGDNQPLKTESDCEYLEELNQVDVMITKIIFDGRKDTVRNEHRVEALRCLKMAMPSLARI